MDEAWVEPFIVVVAHNVAPGPYPIHRLMPSGLLLSQRVLAVKRTVEHQVAEYDKKGCLGHSGIIQNEAVQRAGKCNAPIFNSMAS